VRSTLSFISAAAGNESARFLEKISVAAAGAAALGGSPFLPFLVGLFVIAAAFFLWIELLLREAAVYVIVLMLPLAFAAFVWPARRIWAVRAVELLVALILSKFAIVAVLSLGGAAISSAGSSLTGLMAGAVLVMLAAFSPWALLRLIPLAEIASGAVGPLRGELKGAVDHAQPAHGRARRGEEEWLSWAAAATRNADAGMANEGRPPTPGNPTEPGDDAPVAAGTSKSPVGETTPASEAQTANDESSPDSSAQRWRDRPVLTLGTGEKLGSTPVYPHEDAE
jgi:hypothetical protein